MPAHIYLIKALTNLHVGSGDSNYGPVDKMIQLDAVTQFPTIFGQSLKGSLREYFETRVLQIEEPDLSKEKWTQAIFGSPVIRKNGEEPEQGSFTFTSADLLAIPIPDKGTSPNKAFHLQGSETQLSAFWEKAKAFGYNKSTQENLRNALACTNWEADKFQQASRQIPVIARNYLNNGISQNLWYEQFLPHQSVFGVIIFSNSEYNWKTFHTNLHNKVVQIGANATVGYGYCQFTQLQ